MRVILAFASLALAVTTFAQQPCENIKNAALPGLTITSATSVPAGSFNLPAARNRNGGVEVPAFCRVAGVIAP